MSKYIAIYLLLIVGLISCNIKEDMSDCPGTILLDYTSYTDEILDEIEPDEQVHVYIFDKNGKCCQIYNYTYGELEAIDFEFKVPRNYNGQNAVVWHGNDATDYSDNRMVIGESYENFFLRLNYNIANATFTHVPAPLWASPLEPVEYCASKSRHRIHMTRIHTNVNVNLRQRTSSGSIKELDMDDYQTRITASNDVYHTDFSLENSECCMLKFTNDEELAQSTFLDWAHVGTLRITPDMDCKLQIAPTTALDRPLSVGGTTQIDLVKYMLQSRGATSADTEAMSDQRFLDLNKVWNIDLLVDPSYVAVALTINGWTVWFDDIDL